jgi:hypothetical protein
MAMTDAPAGFTNGNLFRHVSVMSVTSSIGLMAIFAVDLIDVVFISMLGRSELAAAAGYAVSIRRGTRSRGLDSFLLGLPVPWEQFRQA